MLDGDCRCLQWSACFRSSWIPVAAVAGMVVGYEVGETSQQGMLTPETRIPSNACVRSALMPTGSIHGSRDYVPRRSLSVDVYLCYLRTCGLV